METSRDRCIPRLAPGCNPSSLRLSPAQAYLLSRVDGATPWRLLREIGGLAPEEAEASLRAWLASGLIELGGEAGRGGPGAAPRQRATRPPTVGPCTGSRNETPPAPDPELDIPVEVQERILAFEARLDAPYHELLGVPPDAGRRELRRAYFALSREFHPDRYFGRKVGPFGARLERIFRRLTEAYEMLGDPAARAAARDSRAAEERSRAAAGRPEGPLLRRLRAEQEARRLKAKSFFETGMAAAAAERFAEAAAAVRMALAFDPENALYRERFAAVQARAREERARRLLAEADAAFELRDYAEALDAYEAALAEAPADPRAHQRAALLALRVRGDLRAAREYALRACELEPEVAAHHRLLGQVYASAGLHRNARREFRRALELDPGDAEARRELRALRRRGLLSGGSA